MEHISYISMIKRSKRTHWISLFIDRNTAVYFDSFGIEYIPQEVLNKIRDKSITHNIVTIQDDNSVMCALLDYTNLFSPNHYKKNENVIYKYFKEKYVKSRI